MFTHAWPVSRLRRATLLLALLVPLQAAAGIQIERFGYSKFAPGVTIEFLDTFDSGGPLDSGGSYDWRTRVGTIKDKDEDSGLHLKPWWRGAPFNIGPFETRAQVLELQTPLTGAEAINNAPSGFVVYAVYELDSYMSSQFSVGVGLTDVFRGAGTRAIAATVERDGDSYYAKFSNALTGAISDRQLLNIIPEVKYVEVFIQREHFTSDSVISGYALRDEDFDFIGPVRPLFGLQLAFSDVVLSPVLFAAVPIPEAETWALLLVGLAVIGYRVRSRRR